MHQPCRRGAQGAFGMKITALLSLALMSFGIGLAHAEPPKPEWTAWEQANAVSQEGDWLVVRQPDEGHCYLKQSFDGYVDVMELKVPPDRRPELSLPFLRGLPKEVRYAVDKGPMRTVPEGDIGPVITHLPESLIPVMAQGRVLEIEADPLAKPVVRQSFSLEGFTAALDWLGSEECRQKAPDQYQLRGGTSPPSVGDQ